MRIGLSYDLKESMPTEAAGPDDAGEEYDSTETIELIAASLQAGGHSVVRLGGGEEFLRNTLADRPDFVFNIAEGRGNYRSRESQVPAILEMLAIPYSGSDPQCLMICLDKPLTKKLVSLAGVVTPKWLVISDRDELDQVTRRDFPFPAIVKPVYEGSSKGIRLTSLVKDAREATEEIKHILERYQQPVMIEEFISGDEITMGIIGNAPAEVLGIMRVLPRETSDYFVYSLEVKRNYRELVDYECPARLGVAVLQELEKAGINAYKVLGCRDFARLDFRIGPDGRPYFIEINPLPGLGNHSDLVIMAKHLGINHQELIARVLTAASERYPQCIRV